MAFVVQADVVDASADQAVDGGPAGVAADQVELVVLDIAKALSMIGHTRGRVVRASHPSPARSLSYSLLNSQTSWEKNILTASYAVSYSESGNLRIAPACPLHLPAINPTLFAAATSSLLP